MAVTIQDDMVRVGNRLSEADRMTFYFALIEYAENGTEPSEDEPWFLAFEAFRDRLELSHKSYENGKKGGRPKTSKEVLETQSETQSETLFEGGYKPPLKTPSKTPTEKGYKPPTKTEKEKEKEKENKKENEKEINKGAQKRHIFAPPTVDELVAYGMNYDPSFFDSHDARDFAEIFIDYYTQQGWKLSNGNKMKDVYAAFRNWIRRDRAKGVSVNAKKYDDVPVIELGTAF
jgi:hypothetical protein